MSPRPRLQSDAEILAATARAIERVGPRRLTLAHVGREAGMAPATLLQRFGSKRGLLLALAQSGASGVREEFARIRAGSPSPLHAVGAIGACMARMAKSPEAFANHLAFLEMDLADPEFHALALAHAREFRRQLRTLLNDAVRTGELRRCSTAGLANAIQGMMGGSLLNWAVHRQGKPMPWLSADLDMLLSPYRAQAASRRGRGPSKGPPKPQP